MDRQHYHVDGRAVPPGRPVKTPAGWVEPAPVRCSNGHPLRPGSHTVGWAPCKTATRIGHRTHTCDECGAVVYTPPLDSDCRCGRQRSGG